MLIKDIAQIVDKFLETNNCHPVLFKQIEINVFQQFYDIHQKNVIFSECYSELQSYVKLDLLNKYNEILILGNLLQDQEIYKFFRLFLDTRDEYYYETFLELVEMEYQRLEELFSKFSHPAFFFEFHYNVKHSQNAWFSFHPILQPKSLQHQAAIIVRRSHCVATGMTEQDIIESCIPV
jgi:hypothetical protein